MQAQVIVPNPRPSGDGAVAFEFEDRPAESDLVEKIWRNDSGSVSTFFSVAKPHLLMVFAQQQGKTWVTIRGPETRATEVACPQDAEWVGIFFKLGVHMPALPTSSLVDGEVRLPGSVCRSFRLNGSTWQMPTFENADSFVARLAREGLIVRDEAVDATLRGDPPRLSPRSLQRRFVQSTGLTHGSIRQFARAQSAYRLLRGGTPILDVVERAGYFDQPHLTHALKRFMGQTPAQILARPAPISTF